MMSYTVDAAMQLGNYEFLPGFPIERVSRERLTLLIRELRLLTTRIKEELMEYDFLVDTYATERIKTVSVWSMFRDEDLHIRPHPLQKLDRSPLEHMVHQCISEDKWFRAMLEIDVSAPPLPEKETRLEFIKRYAEDSANRLTALRAKDKEWWEKETSFFDARRARTWIMLRRIAHTAHHRGEQTVMLRLLEREVHSVYGPGAHTGGLPVNNAQTIYAYPDVESLLEGESKGGRKALLPGPGSEPCTERP